MQVRVKQCHQVTRVTNGAIWCTFTQCQNSKTRSECWNSKTFYRSFYCYS